MTFVVGDRFETKEPLISGRKRGAITMIVEATGVSTGVFKVRLDSMDRDIYMAGQKLRKLSLLELIAEASQ